MLWVDVCAVVSMTVICSLMGHGIMGGVIPRGIGPSVKLPPSAKMRNATATTYYQPIALHLIILILKLSECPACLLLRVR
jgi:hypothetical protein